MYPRRRVRLLIDDHEAVALEGFMSSRWVRAIARRGSRAVVLGLVAGLIAGLTVGLVGAAPSSAITPTYFRISATALDFGDVPLGSTSPQQTITVTNVTNAPIVMSGAGGGAGQFGGSQDCQGSTLAAGASCHMYYAFTPSAVGAVTGATNGSWNGQSFALSFKGNGTTQFRISATALDFGDVALGDTSPQQTVTVTNTANHAVVMSGAGGGAGQFGGSQDCQGSTLAAGASCHMYYAFTPSALGAASGSTNGSWNGQSFALSFKGNGISRLLITPTALDFGDVPVGTTGASQTVTVTNRGSSPMVMSGAGGGAGQFGGSQDCQGTTLAAGASCHMYYAFTPSALGAASGSTNGSWNGQSFALSFKGNGYTTAKSAQFQISPTAFDFGNVAVGDTSPTQIVTVTNRGSSNATISMAGGGAGAFGGAQNCEGQSLAPGASCQIYYSFSPTGLGAVTGSTGGSINGQSFAFSFAGNGIRHFLISPTAFDFGNVTLGDPSPTQLVTVRNVGSSAITGSMTGGGAGAFGGAQNCEGVSIPAGGSCQIDYSFTPSALGAASGTTGGTFNGQSFAFSFTGNGIRRFLISPTAFAFGTVTVGTTSPSQSVTITNEGASAITGNMTGGGAGAFGGAQNCQGVNLAGGGSCQIQYAYSPTSLGAASGSTGGTFNGQSYAFSFTGTGGPTPLGAAEFVPVTPERLLDTRYGVGYTGSKPVAGQTIQLQVTGAGATDVPAGAAAVVLNVTATAPAAAGSVTVWPCGSPKPWVSNLNLAAGVTTPNLTITRIGAGGQVCLASTTSTHLIADVTGWYPASTSYQAVQPERLLDTRYGLGYTGAKPAGGQTIQLQVTGAGTTDVPAGAAAVVLNVTATAPATAGSVTVWPCGSPQPWASNLNLRAGVTTANLTITRIGTGGRVCLASTTSTHLIADISGWDPAMTTYRSVQPERLLDTRYGLGYTGAKPAGGQTIQLQVTGAGTTGVPASAGAVVLNVTATAPEAAGSVTIWPCGSPKPETSNLNLIAGVTTPNLVISALGSGGKVCLASTVSTHLIADISGWYPG